MHLAVSAPLKEKAGEIRSQEEVSYPLKKVIKVNLEIALEWKVRKSLGLFGNLLEIRFFQNRAINRII